MPGPPPIPNERKRLLGNPGKRALPDPANVVALKPAGQVLPEPPDHLGEKGAALWRKAVALGARWIADTDLNLLERYCFALDRWHELREKVTNEGAFSDGSQGQQVLAPWWKAFQEVETTLTKYEQLLGFTPADRARLGTGEVKEASALEQFLSGN